MIFLNPALAYYRETGKMSVPTSPIEEAEDADDIPANNIDDYRNNLTRFGLDILSMAIPSDLNNFQQRKQIYYVGSSTGYDQLVAVGTSGNSNNNNITNPEVSSTYITVFDSAFLNIVILLGEQGGYLSDNLGLKPSEAPPLTLTGDPGGNNEQPGGDGRVAEVIFSISVFAFFMAYYRVLYKRVRRRRLKK